MKTEVAHILACLAVEVNEFTFADTFWDKYKLSPSERDEVCKTVSIILKGYIFSDSETQEIIDIIGESHADVDERVFHSILLNFTDRKMLSKS